MDTRPLEWTPTDARPFIRVPSARDDKYTHGVLGVATGSTRYPGAAVLGVDAAYATGIGMVRYVGPPESTALVLGARPETVPGEGRVDAWLIGSGTEWTAAGEEPEQRVAMALASGAPVVIDAGALPLISRATGPVVATPHAAELERLAASVVPGVQSSDPVLLARAVADTTGAIIVLKGNVTTVVGPERNGRRFERTVTAPTTWLATAGTGDVLAGILGALVATHTDLLTTSPESLGELAATACLIHGLAGVAAGRGGPFGASDIADHIADVIVELVAGRV